MEAATLIEHGGRDHVDHLVVVTAPKEIRIGRAMARDNATREQIEARIDNQMDEATLLSHAQTIIHNDSDMDRLVAQAIKFQGYVAST